MANIIDDLSLKEIASDDLQFILSEYQGYFDPKTTREETMTLLSLHEVSDVLRDVIALVL